jgi:hypothetical protein
LYLDGNARAVEWLSAGLTEMPPEAGQSELFAGYRVQLATAHARARDPEQACSVAAQAALIARQTGSSRLRAQLDRLLAQAVSLRRVGDRRMAQDQRLGG